jgi:hypothetical protein
MALVKIYNGINPTTVSFVKQPTGIGLRTMLQVKLNKKARVAEWGFDADGSAAGVPGVVELIETGAVFATMSTAHVEANLCKYDDPDAEALAAVWGVVVGTTADTGFSTGAVTEGTITASRLFSARLVAPTNQWLIQEPLGRESNVNHGTSLRIRANFAASINAICYVLIDI